MTLEAELGVMQPQAQECWQLPEAGIGKESPLRASVGSAALLTP